MSGRARGRSRGRARGSRPPDQGVPPAHSVGPPQPRRAAGATAAGATAAGATAAGATAPPPPPQPSQQSVQPMPGNGRASHRGGGAVELRPGVVQAPFAQMSGLRLSEQGSMERGRRRGGIVVQEPFTRPTHITDKQGTSGNPIPLLTNCFQLETKPDFILYQYHVSFKPDVQKKGTRLQLVKMHNELLGQPQAFDGMILFIPRRLQNDPTEVYSKLPTDDSVTVQITFKLTGELPPTSYITIHMYNVIFRRVLNIINMKQIGRHYYSPDKGITIPQHKLEVWPGFVTSILKYESNVLLLADISHKLLRTNTVLDTMYDMYNKYGDRDFHAQCTKKLVGEIVLTRYNNRTYRIDDIDWELNPGSTFTSRDGTETKFTDYYLKAHNIKITDMEQPLLISRPKKKDIRRGMDGPFLLVPELCTLTGLSDDARADFHLMKDIAIHTRIPPDGRIKTLQGFINTINSNPEVNKEMAGWGLKFSNTLLPLQGRMLPPEKILQATGHYNYKVAEAEWSREMRGQQLVSCIPLQTWCLIVTRRDASKAFDFIDTLARVAPPMGIQIRPPQVVQLQNDHTQTFLHALKEVVTPGTQLVVCVLPSNRKDTYDAVKKHCCVDCPVPSQVIVARTLMKKQMLMSVSTKIAIQLNCKLGGEVWAVEIPLRELMVVGIDTYHDSVKKGCSVAGLVCSLNKQCTRYYSRVCFQQTHEELVNGIKPNFTAALKKYYEVNNSLPARIVIFRDGVGDGQLETVLEHEIPQLIQCFKMIDDKYVPRLAVVIVKKRINIRFFARAGNTQTNPPPGTCIDQEVTRPEWYDYFIVSQSVRQGTVTPTHYNVVYDNSGMKPDHMQRLTYKLCHLYYNWPGTIRVPAPCQYAHKLAFLVGQSLHREPNLALSDKLFYL